MKNLIDLFQQGIGSKDQCEETDQEKAYRELILERLNTFAVKISNEVNFQDPGVGPEESRFLKK